MGKPQTRRYVSKDAGRALRVSTTADILLDIAYADAQIYLSADMPVRVCCRGWKGRSSEVPVRVYEASNGAESYGWALG